MHKLTSIPNGNPLQSGGPGKIERHGPYKNGGGFPAVNDVDVQRPSLLPIELKQNDDLGLYVLLPPLYFEMGGNPTLCT